MFTNIIALSKKLIVKKKSYNKNVRKLALLHTTSGKNLLKLVFQILSLRVLPTRKRITTLSKVTPVLLILHKNPIPTECEISKVYHYPRN